MTARTALGRAGIIGFCVWHMAAVALYSVPEGPAGSPRQRVRTITIPIISPYLLLTSQWQKWDLFSPNPLRRVTTYALESQRASSWVPVALFRPRAESAWRKDTSLLKALDALDDAQHTPLLLALMRSYCAPAYLPSGTGLRLRRESVVVPSGVAMSEWRAEPPQSAQPDLLTACP